MRFTPPPLLAILVLCLATLPAVDVAATEEGPRPGLPRHVANGPARWVGVAQGGVTEAKRARQWARVPMQVTTAFTLSAPTHPEPGKQLFRNTSWVYLMAEPGARHNYGLTAPFQVNTTAFGTIPVTATLRLSQERTPDGFPVPMVVEALDELYPDATKPPDWPSSQKYHDTDITAELYVEVVDLRVDDTDLPLRAGCRTESPAELDLHGEGFFRDDPEVEDHGVYATGRFTVIEGGLLAGTVDVPSFSHCTTRQGEDISPLLTAAVSGPENAVSLHLSGGAACGRVPELHEYQPEVGCPAGTPPTVPFPQH